MGEYCRTHRNGWRDSEWMVLEDHTTHSCSPRPIAHWFGGMSWFKIPRCFILDIPANQCAIERGAQEWAVWTCDTSIYTRRSQLHSRKPFLLVATVHLTVEVMRHPRQRVVAKDIRFVENRIEPKFLTPCPQLTMLINLKLFSDNFSYVKPIHSIDQGRIGRTVRIRYE